MVHNSVYDSGQPAKKRAKKRRNILKRVQSKFILCKIDNLKANVKALLVIPT